MAELTSTRGRSSTTLSDTTQAVGEETCGVIGFLRQRSVLRGGQQRVRHDHSPYAPRRRPAAGLYIAGLGAVDRSARPRRRAPRPKRPLVALLILALRNGLLHVNSRAHVLTLTKLLR